MHPVLQVLARLAPGPVDVDPDELTWWLAAFREVFAELAEVDPGAADAVLSLWWAPPVGRASGQRLKAGSWDDAAAGLLGTVRAGEHRGALFSCASRLGEDRQQPFARVVVRAGRGVEGRFLTAAVHVRARTPVPPLLAPMLAGVLTRAVRELPIDYANLTDDNWDDRRTAWGQALLKAGHLSRAVNRSGPATTIPSASWVTFLGASHLERVGGVDALEASGAFVKVDRDVDGAGGALLRATNSLGDFHGTRVRDVRRALAPVLPTGAVRSEGQSNAMLRSRVAWDDDVDGPTTRPPHATGDSRPRTRLPPIRLEATVVLEHPSDRELADVTDWWVRRVLRADTQVSGLDALSEPDIWVEWASMCDAGPPRQDSGRRSTASSLKRLHEAMGRGGAAGCSVGWTSTVPGADALHVAVVVSSWREVIMRGELWLGPDAALDAVHDAESAMTQLVVDTLDAHSGVFAYVSDDNPPGTSGLCALEVAHHRTSASPPLAPDQLRGYSWITCLTPVQAERLGGRDAIEATGAFWCVEETRHGLVLRATQHLADYCGPAVRAVREAVGDLLLPLPVVRSDDARDQADEAAYRIAWDDGLDGPFGYGADDDAFEIGTYRR